MKAAGLCEDDFFFYHSDHLGSTSYVTDHVSAPTQFICYMPYGESLIDEHTTSTEMPWKFNGKELDAETGLYYYGARYYEPGIALWYGVDAMTEKYPNLGGYVYCAGNPVKHVDPDGNDPWSAIAEGVAAFAMSAGIDFTANMLMGQDAQTALKNVNWSEALYEGGKATAWSFLSTGRGTAKFIAKLSKNKHAQFIAKVVDSVSKELVSSVKEKFENHEYNDFDDIDWGQELYAALFKTAVNLGCDALSDKLKGKISDKCREEIAKTTSRTNSKFQKAKDSFASSYGERVGNRQRRVCANKDARKYLVDQANFEADVEKVTAQYIVGSTNSVIKKEYDDKVSH